MSTPHGDSSRRQQYVSRSWAEVVRGPRPASRHQERESTIKSDVNGSAAAVASLPLASTKSDVNDNCVLLDESKPLTLLNLRAAMSQDDDNKSKLLKNFIRKNSVGGMPVCVVTELLEGGGARVALELVESLGLRLNWVAVTDNSLWIVEFGAGMVHEGVTQGINTQLKNGIDALGLDFFYVGGAPTFDIPDLDHDMAPDGNIQLVDGPQGFMNHSMLFVEVGDSQLLGNCGDPKTLLGKTAQWLSCGVATNICVLIAKLYGKADNDSDGMTMALINKDGVQWIRSWGNTLEDDTSSIFRAFSTDFWVVQQGRSAVPETPEVSAAGFQCHISLKNHFPVLGQENLQRFVGILQRETEGGVLGAPPEYTTTRDALVEQLHLLEIQEDNAIFVDNATIPIDSDRIYGDYQRSLRTSRAKRRRLN